MSTGNGSTTSRHIALINDHDERLARVEKTLDAVAYNQGVFMSGQARIEKQQTRVIELLERLVGDTIITEVKVKPRDE